MKTAEEFTKAYFSKGFHQGEELKLAFLAYGQEIREQVIAIINEARSKGEWDIRSVRTLIERMEIK